MTSLIEQLIGFVSDHAWLAYLTIFLAALLEAVPVFGSVIPGSTIILALSALVPGGELAIAPVFASAIGGALIGDGAAFWIGHRAKRQILDAWPMSRYPGLVVQSEAFFRRYGTPAVLFARFVPPVRAFIPVTAGALDMPPSRFYPVNGVAIVLWASAHILPGVLAVSLLRPFSGFAMHYWMPIVIGIAAIAGLATWWVRRRRGINLPAPSRRN